MTPLFIPSPPFNTFSVGPLTIHVYALTMLTGIVAAYVIGRRRWVQRGGTVESWEGIVLWAVPCGIIGARIYHVLTHWGDYFGPGHLNPFAIWEGGIAMFGSLIGGVIGAYIGARRNKANLLAFADALAPGMPIAQAIGRLGNWFNQELFGYPTDQPWGLEIDPAHRPAEFAQYATFQPTFLYEMLLNLLAAAIIFALDRRLRLGHGSCFALYIGLYGAIRFVIEGMRTDFSYYLGPLRTNQITALLVCVGGLTAFFLIRRFWPGRDAPLLEGADASHQPAATSNDENKKDA